MLSFHDDQTLYATGFGTRRVGTADAVDADTVFQLASVSKSVGATAVATQVGAGVVSWDSRVHERLPWFALADAYTTQNVTIGDLYAHRSGLPDHAGDRLEDMGFGQRDVLRRLRYLPLRPLREHYAYTNFGFHRPRRSRRNSMRLAGARRADPRDDERTGRSLVGKPRPGSPAPARPLLEYAGTYRNDYHGPATIAFNGDSLTLAIGPAPLSRPLAHWDGDVFTFTLVDENASPGTISKATFAAGRVTYEYYDGKGLGTFAR